MKHNLISKLLVAAVPVLATGSALAEGDGFPHIAVAQELSGELVLEYAIDFGLDTTDPQKPIVNLVAPTFSGFFGGYQTSPLTPTAFPNSDLGFVSEVEGSTEEGGAINGDIVVRMLSKDADFKAFFSGSEIFTGGSPDFELGSAFDTHPTWVLSSTQGDLAATASASFEVFNVSGGAIGSGNEQSLGTFDVALSVPEPTSGLLVLAGAGLIAARRRRRA
jgi:hypothetical protein